MYIEKGLSLGYFQDIFLNIMLSCTLCIGTPFSHSQKLHYCLVRSVYFHDQMDLVIINAHHPKPWLLFHSKSEFALAEIILNSSLSSSQVDCLIEVVQTLIHNGEPFMVRDHCELKTLWEVASDMLAPVCF